MCRLDLKACKVLDDVTSDGRLFHILAVAAGKSSAVMASGHSSICCGQNKFTACTVILVY